MTRRTGGFLDGIRVIEVADELGEYCGRVLAGMGADVIKVEPPSGEATRRNGPFFEDEPDPDRSLYFWHYNLGKRGIVLDLDVGDDRRRFERLVESADIVIDTRGDGDLDAELGFESLRERNPGLIFCRISPFGEDGPWAGWRGTDLIHLALGGVAMNCGYDPDPSGRYDTPPMAPQMWQAYHITGEMAVIGILGALYHREATGKGQKVSISAHQAVSFNTETDVPDWIYQRTRHVRQTCRHSMAKLAPPAISRTKDGRWILPYRTYLPGSFGDPYGATVRLLERHGMAMDLADEEFAAEARSGSEAANFHIGAVLDAVIGRTKFDADIWREAQDEGLAWAPSRRPEENLGDEHWRIRGTFIEVEHPELDRSFEYIGPRWCCDQVPWTGRDRAPLLGEHTEAVLAELDSAPPAPSRGFATAGSKARNGSSPARPGRALEGVKVLDLSWLLASAGAGRFLASMGAEVIKVEHESRLDAMRFGLAMAPDGGRAERDEATGPINPSDSDSPNRSGAFMEINTGKRAISLNLKSERGKEILTEMIASADILIEGFSPGTMDRMGFGYERLRAINPALVYVQQSGTGQKGTYGRLRSYGPTAQAFSGISEMSGLPEPYAPAGIGYSYLDWFGAYNVAGAALAGLHRSRRTGEGCWIDAAQVEVGIFLTGTAVLDYSANGRSWRRSGNRAVARPAAPHGIYPAAGEDRWIAIATDGEDDWRTLLRILEDRDLSSDHRFATLEQRIHHEDELDAAMARATVRRDAFELAEQLQDAGVAAGVCQTAEDRVESDPQLSHLGWITELTQAEIGTWPAKKTPISLSLTPLDTGGPDGGRHGPSYGQDTAYVLRELLGRAEDDIKQLEAEGVV